MFEAIRNLARSVCAHTLPELLKVLFTTFTIIVEHIRNQESTERLIHMFVTRRLVEMLTSGHLKSGDRLSFFSLYMYPPPTPSRISADPRSLLLLSRLSIIYFKMDPKYLSDLITFKTTPIYHLR